MKLYQAIAQNHRLVGTEQFGDAADARMTRIEAFLPRGSGFDNGTSIESCNANRIIFNTSFHHMDENGFYCGWSEHKVIITANLTHEIDVRVTGRNMRNIKEYISEMFAELMYREFKWIEGV